MEYGVLSYILGRIYIVISLAMLLPLAVAVYYQENWLAFAYSIAVGLITGLSLACLGRTRGEIHRREGYFIVTLTWLGASLLGSFPYLLTGTFSNFADAFFETVSGFTTTGSSVMTNIEIFSRSVLLWRSLTQWLGGMGIVVLTVAILSQLRNGSLHLMQAEVPGPSVEKLKPKITDTARVLWLTYTLITAVEVILLTAAGMPLFEAVTHTFTTLATGGFSPKNASIGFYETPVIHWIVAFFMFLAGANFALYYQALRRRSPIVFWKDPEFRFYSFIIIGASLAVAVNLFLRGSYRGEELIRVSFFQVVSIMTTTGFMTVDFDLWPDFSRFLLLVLMFIGGCYGSTGGAIKVGRVLMALKFTLPELRRIIHPQAVMRVVWGHHVLSSETITSVVHFAVLYLFIFVLGVLAISLTGANIETAFSAVATTLGNVGPGLDAVGPTKNFAHFPDGAKYIFSFLMLLGRLEIYPLLVLFMREGWKR